MGKVQLEEARTPALAPPVRSTPWPRADRAAAPRVAEAVGEVDVAFDGPRSRGRPAPDRSSRDVQLGVRDAQLDHRAEADLLAGDVVEGRRASTNRYHSPTGREPERAPPRHVVAAIAAHSYSCRRRRRFATSRSDSTRYPDRCNTAIEPLHRRRYFRGAPRASPRGCVTNSFRRRYSMKRVPMLARRRPPCRLRAAPGAVGGEVAGPVRHQRLLGADRTPTTASRSSARSTRSGSRRGPRGGPAPAVLGPRARYLRPGPLPGPAGAGSRGVGLRPAAGGLGAAGLLRRSSGGGWRPSSGAAGRGRSSRCCGCWRGQPAAAADRASRRPGIGAIDPADAVRLILEHRGERPVGLFRLDGRPHLKWCGSPGPTWRPTGLAAGGAP